MENILFDQNLLLVLFHQKLHKCNFLISAAGDQKRFYPEVEEKKQGRGERRGSSWQAVIFHWAPCRRGMFHFCLKAFQAGLLLICTACRVPHRTDGCASAPLLATSALNGPAASRSHEVSFFGNPSCGARFPGCGLCQLGGRDHWQRHGTGRRKL